MDALIPRRGGQKPAPRRYPDELRERAVRLVKEARKQQQELSLNAAVQRIAPTSGGRDQHAAGLVQARHHEGREPGVMTVDTARIKELERANRGLKRTHEMAASTGGRNDL